MREYMTEYRKNNSERITKILEKSQDKNRETIRKRSRDYYRKMRHDPEWIKKTRAVGRKWYWNNKKKKEEENGQR